ncbi:hypothetical protein HPG69_019536 [Diceros bicornis minor]|uniref:Lipase n=1 Tax=Diceros bicornis minor TaxID=77932 RepID=A0A7J7E636_DICBM|nr:hypothetical protein HPG69_019536 [Diceros bicornis minor]
MWWLLTTVCLIQMFGNTFCLFGKKPVNPEANMNISQMISYWGYPHEMHEVITADGYILPLYRIPHGKNDANRLVQKPVVYLQHGLLVTASNWILNPPDKSLGFLLADAGYDVWLGNSRGNRWSRKHLYLETNSKEFWAFSFDEMVKYDLPATIDFIVKNTGEKKIYYVGHSQGTLIAFAAFATNPQLAEKIKINFALAPAATLTYTTKFLPHTNMNKIIGQDVCNHAVIGTICNNLLTLVSGYNPKNLNENRLDVYLTKIPAGTSVQNILHYSQVINKGTFQAYDWGNSFLNILHHNQPTPPLYHVEDMKVPTAIWSGGRDILADPIDVKNLEGKISNLIYHKKIPSYNHLDFVLGLDVYDQIYTEIITMMNESQ